MKNQGQRELKEEIQRALIEKRGKVDEWEEINWKEMDKEGYLEKQ